MRGNSAVPCPSPLTVAPACVCTTVRSLQALAKLPISQNHLDPSLYKTINRLGRHQDRKVADAANQFVQVLLA